MSSHARRTAHDVRRTTHPPTPISQSRRDWACKVCRYSAIWRSENRISSRYLKIISIPLLLEEERIIFLAYPGFEPTHCVTHQMWKTGISCVLFLFNILAGNVDYKSIWQKTLNQFWLAASKYERKSRYKSNVTRSSTPFWQCMKIQCRISSNNFRRTAVLKKKMNCKLKLYS